MVIGRFLLLSAFTLLATAGLAVLIYTSAWMFKEAVFWALP